MLSGKKFLKGSKRIMKIQRAKVILIGIAMQVSFVAILGAGAPIPAASLPFAPGDKFTYKLKWGPFPAGTAILEMRNPEPINGDAAYHFVFSFRTNRFADHIYKMRDRFEGYVDLAMSHTVHFSKVEQHRSTKQKTEVLFDWKELTARYHRQGVTDQPIAIEEGAFDPVSIIFAMRNRTLEVGSKFSIPMTDGKSISRMPIRVVKKQKIKTKAGRFDTLMLQTDMKHFSRKLKKQSLLKIWFSDDKEKIPVRFQLKIKWGSFKADLLSVERNAGHRKDVYGQ